MSYFIWSGLDFVHGVIFQLQNISFGLWIHNNLSSLISHRKRNESIIPIFYYVFLVTYLQVTTEALEHTKPSRLFEASIIMNNDSCMYTLSYIIVDSLKQEAEPKSRFIWPARTKALNPPLWVSNDCDLSISVKPKHALLSSSSLTMY